MKKIIHNPHDKFFRSSMSDSRVAKAFFEYHLPLAIREKIDLNTLQLQKDTFVDEDLKLALTDIVFSVSFQGQPGYLYTLIEHQTKPDRLMPFRLLKYLIAIMEQHLKTTQQTQLPLIYPMLFYTGEAKYPYSTDLFDLFNDPDGLAKQVFLQPFQLIDISQISDDMLKQDAWRGIMELCMKHIFARDILPFLENMVNLLQEAEQAGGRSYVQAALTYLLTTSEVSNSEAFLKTIQTSLSSETGANIMTIAQQLKAEGRMEGETLGIQKGQFEAKKSIARKLLQQGLSIETICQITELSFTEIQALTEPPSH